MEQLQKFLIPILLLIIIILLIVVARLLISHPATPNLERIHTTVASPVVSPSSFPNIINQVTFTCNDNKSIRALFYGNRVELTLSDGRNYALPQVMSGSGVRYANDDENFVFWNKGNTAFITEANKTTFQNCVTAAK